MISHALDIVLDDVELPMNSAGWHPTERKFAKAGPTTQNSGDINNHERVPVTMVAAWTSTWRWESTSIESGTATRSGNRADSAHGTRRTGDADHSDQHQGRTGVSPGRSSSADLAKISP